MIGRLLRKIYYTQNGVGNACGGCCQSFFELKESLVKNSRGQLVRKGFCCNDCLWVYKTASLEKYREREKRRNQRRQQRLRKKRLKKKR